MNRDYSSISPSAKSLLMLKSLTDIPFIKAAAEIIYSRYPVNWMKTHLKDPLFFRSLIHFEERYDSIDRMLAEFGGKNILEMSSGFSFRGLSMAVNDPDVTYIDTDLPEVVETKLDLCDQLVTAQSLDLQGELIIQPLNVLDEHAFSSVVSQFKPGPVTIVNEGLLMYLDPEEKVKLCRIIHDLLKQLGGHWITTDIYIKKEMYTGFRDSRASKFLEEHNVEEKKFNSFEEAESFFIGQGFRVVKKSEPDYRRLSAFRYLSQEQIEKMRENRAGSPKFRIRETWVLDAV